jgi:hypothetical protein
VGAFRLRCLHKGHPGGLSVVLPPLILGDMVVGQTLFASHGTYNATPDSFSPQWYLDGAALTDETADTMLVLDAYVGSVITYKEVAHKSAYTDSSLNASSGTSAVTDINLTTPPAISSVTRTSASGDNTSAFGMQVSIAFGSNVYAGYMLRCQVWSTGIFDDDHLVQDIYYELTNDDVVSGANLPANLLAAGLTKIGATQYLGLTVYTTSPNGVGYSYTYSPPISPTDAVLALTWNPGDKASTVVLTSGNLDAANHSGSYAMVRATASKTSGKWYYEVKIVSLGNLGQTGWANASADLNNALGTDNNSVCNFFVGNVFYGGGSVGGGSIGSGAINDIMQMAVDIGAGKVWFGRNNSWDGNPAAGTGGYSVPGIVTFFPAFDAKDGEVLAQFTAASQTYSPPSGFMAIG